MSNNSTQDVIDALDELLDQEKQALLEGDLERISRQAEYKETLIDQLNKIEFEDANILSAIQSKVTRNQDLLNSALDGIRAVAKRLAVLRKVKKSLQTYDETGRKRSIEALAQPSVEKRA